MFKEEELERVESSEVAARKKQQNCDHEWTKRCKCCGLWKEGRKKKPLIEVRL